MRTMPTVGVGAEPAVGGAGSVGEMIGSGEREALPVVFIAGVPVDAVVARVTPHPPRMKTTASIAGSLAGIAAFVPMRCVSSPSAAPPDQRIITSPSTQTDPLPIMSRGDRIPSNHGTGKRL